MEIAVVGKDMRTLCSSVGVNARTFSALSAVVGGHWDLLALAPEALASLPEKEVRATTLLLPGDSGSELARELCAVQLVGYGFSPRDTLTFSGVTGEERLLCLQRAMLTLRGTLLEPQELPLPGSFSSLSAERALLAAGLRLLTDARL